ncbi:sigma-70 family RNA polymerase sigma factor [Herbaspirillum sp. alder98]|uniref:sigma-70 family RNA polymerase sigma factor n=1 Tax=Herbaspirillum sp. alder98 TaxID=2913096 RepID=UPI0039BD3809
MNLPTSCASTDVESLYSDHHSWLRGWLARRVGNAEQAADLAQDTFMRLLSSERVPSSLDEPRAYLTTVAQNLVSNLWRREKLEKAYLDALGQLPVNLAPSPEEQAMVLETLAELDQLLEGLPAIQRSAFLLSQLDGQSHAEVAATLGISIPTVKRYLVKALQRCYFADISFLA